MCFHTSNYSRSSCFQFNVIHIPQILSVHQVDDIFFSQISQITNHRIPFSPRACFVFFSSSRYKTGSDLTEKVYAAIAQFNPFCLKNGIPYYFSVFSPWLPLRYLQCFPCRDRIPSADLPQGQNSRIHH